MKLRAGRRVAWLIQTIIERAIPPTPGIFCMKVKTKALQKKQLIFS